MSLSLAAFWDFVVATVLDKRHCQKLLNLSNLEELLTALIYLVAPSIEGNLSHFGYNRLD